MIPNGMVKTKTLRSYFSHFHTRVFLVLCNRSYSYNCAINCPCADQIYYTGCTEDLDARIKRHQSGYIEYTKTRLPVELIFYSAFKQNLHLSLKST